MRYKHLCQKSDDVFKRLSGVTRPIFDTMVSIVAQVKKTGRPHSLSFEDQALLTLEYLRTYKTQLELSADYGISESNINRTIIKVENALIKSGQFNLLKRIHKPTNQTDDAIFEYVLIDATEVPCQRPKKATTLIQWQTKTTYPKNPSHL